MTRQSLSISRSDVASASGSTGLPAIQVPKFDGDYRNFSEWSSLFDALVDSKTHLEPVEKLHYLKTALRTEGAKHLLKDLPLEGKMYQEAYSYVKGRYVNKRATIATYFDELLNFAQISMPTLRTSLDKMHAIIRGLRACDLNVEQMSPLITFIFLSKFPRELRVEWENSHLDYSTYPSFDPLAKFLQNRCLAYESMNTLRSVTKATERVGGERRDVPNKKSSFLTTGESNIVTCALCEKEHFIASCPNFLKLSRDEKFEVVRKKRLCLNCFRMFHQAIDCRSSKCRKCNRKHHTLLHIDRQPVHQKETASKEQRKFKQRITCSREKIQPKTNNIAAERYC